MTTKLSLYNGALLECGERDLATLTDAVEPRRLLDRVWDNGAVDYCLGRGQWSFAKRSMQLAPSTTLTPAYGYSKAYDIPSDLVRTTAFTSDEYGNTPITQYAVEGPYWFTDVEPVYLGYISNDATFGGDMVLWPADFVRAVEVYLASRIVKKLTQSEDAEVTLFKKAERMFKDAASSDSMEGPTKFLPPSGWSLARRGGSSPRGNRGSLIG
jgi:hypothetical protein